MRYLWQKTISVIRHINIISTVFLFETGDAQVFLKTVDRIKELLHIYNSETMMIRTLFYWVLLVNALFANT
jgi:hypothetical protein